MAAINMFDVLNADDDIQEDTIEQIRQSKGKRSKTVQNKVAPVQYKLYVVKTSEVVTKEIRMNCYNFPLAIELSQFKTVVLSSMEDRVNMAVDGLQVTDYTPKRYENTNPRVVFISLPKMDDGSLLASKVAKELVVEQLKNIRDVEIISNVSCNIRVTRAEKVLMTFEKLVPEETCILVVDILKLMTWDSDAVEGIEPDQRIRASFANL